jgi:hypothetical protein
MPSLRINRPPRNGGEGSEGVTLYYKGVDVRITHEVFESRRPIRQSYVISELEYVHVARESGVRALVGRPPVTVCSSGFAGVCLAVASVDWPTPHEPAVVVAALVALAASSALAGASWGFARRPLELRAVHRGRLVCLFQTADRRTFDQVTRALRRVFEHAEDAR